MAIALVIQEEKDMMSEEEREEKEKQTKEKKESFGGFPEDRAKS